LEPFPLKSLYVLNTSGRILDIWTLRSLFPILRIHTRWTPGSLVYALVLTWFLLSPQFSFGSVSLLGSAMDENLFLCAHPFTRYLYPVPISVTSNSHESLEISPSVAALPCPFLRAFGFSLPPPCFEGVACKKLHTDFHQFPCFRNLASDIDFRPHILGIHLFVSSSALQRYHSRYIRLARFTVRTQTRRP